MTMTSSGDAGQRRAKDMQNIWERTKIHRKLRDDHDVTCSNIRPKQKESLFGF